MPYCLRWGFCACLTEFNHYLVLRAGPRPCNRGQLVLIARHLGPPWYNRGVFPWPRFSDNFVRQLWQAHLPAQWPVRMFFQRRQSLGSNNWIPVGLYHNTFRDERLLIRYLELGLALQLLFFVASAVFSQDRSWCGRLQRVRIHHLPLILYNLKNVCDLCLKLLDLRREELLVIACDLLLVLLKPSNLRLILCSQSLLIGFHLFHAHLELRKVWVVGMLVHQHRVWMDSVREDRDISAATLKLLMWGPIIIIRGLMLLEGCWIAASHCFTQGFCI